MSVIWNTSCASLPWTHAALDYLYVESIIWCHWKGLNHTSHCFLLFSWVFAECMLYRLDVCCSLCLSVLLATCKLCICKAVSMLCLCRSVSARLCSCIRTCICVHPCRQTTYKDKTAPRLQFAFHAHKCFLFECTYACADFSIFLISSTLLGDGSDAFFRN